MSLLQDMVLLPLGMALVLGTIATCALRSQRIRTSIEQKWYHQPEDGERKVAQRGCQISSASSASDQADHLVLDVGHRSNRKGQEMLTDCQAVLPGMVE